jgi:hypothetical protein
LPKQESVVGWGPGLPYADLTVNPEFPSYSEDKSTIAMQTAMKLGSNNSTLFGL